VSQVYFTQLPPVDPREVWFKANGRHLLSATWGRVGDYLLFHPSVPPAPYTGITTNLYGWYLPKGETQGRATWWEIGHAVGSKGWERCDPPSEGDHPLLEGREGSHHMTWVRVEGEHG
jgi:hypothetical protein